MTKFNFFRIASVSTTDFTNSLFTWSFVSSGFAIMVDSTVLSEVIQYSFDGENVHGELTPTKPSEAMTFDSRHESEIWFRLKTAGSAVPVRLEVWA